MTGEGMVLGFAGAAGIIRDAIVRSRYQAARLVNRELLSLYYGVGKSEPLAKPAGFASRRRRRLRPAVADSGASRCQQTGCETQPEAADGREQTYIRVLLESQYVSENSRAGHWGKGAIMLISETLQRELPGLRGFSEGSLKKMRLFYEEWSGVILNRSLTMNDLERPHATEFASAENAVVSAIPQQGALTVLCTRSGIGAGG